MLRITVENKSKTATLKLEGKLAGPWIGELERTWAQVTANTSGDRVLLDLCDVTFIAAEGKQQLKKMSDLGAQFKTSGCMSRSIVEEITRMKNGE
jgi:hypothetical protein